MGEFTSILLATAGGIFPALIWLWFWLREDMRHPEPRYLIALAFVAGAFTVALVIPIQKAVAGIITGTILIFVLWSLIEEIAKYTLARITVLNRRDADEPIDMVIYMVTVALGFAAIENALFLLSPLAGTTPVEAFLTGNLRFVGATLLHVLSSAVVGAFLAFSFYKTKTQKMIYTVTGIILAAALHSGFNVLILRAAEEHLLRTFALVWIGVIIMLAVLEYIKRLR